MAHEHTGDVLTALTDQTLAAAIRDEGPVVVDFWAPGCPPCTVLARTLTDLAREFDGRVRFATVNADDSPRSTVAYRIMATPTVLVFSGGAVVDSFVGARPKSALRQLLPRHTEPTSEVAVAGPSDGRQGPRDARHSRVASRRRRQRDGSVGSAVQTM
jgi:thioredoxin 1